MLLVVDIGNTTITTALMANARIKRTVQIKSTIPKAKLSADIKRALSKLGPSKGGIKHALICSVVPSLTPLVARVINNVGGCSPKIIGKDITVPIKNKYENPKQVGIDRLVGAFGARELLGMPVIIVDFGTAITIDGINNKGEYEGGIIIPGIRLSIESLFSKTALLPNIENVHAPKNIIGKNTEDSILSGIFYGYGAMCSQLIRDIKSGKGTKNKIPSFKNAKIVLTGGYTEIMKRYMSVKINSTEPHLVLKALALLHKKTNSG